MVVTAVAGGALSLWGTARQRKDAATGARMVMASYILMSVSIVFFAIRGVI